MQASEASSGEIVNILIEAGANINGRTAIDYAESTGNIEALDI